MNHTGSHIVCIAFFLLSSGCLHRQPDEPDKQPVNPEKEEESLVRVNQYLVSRDVEVIENYIDRRGWEMEVTPTGLWYMIYRKGEGQKVVKGNRVTIDYTISLLDGTLCYDSGDDGPKHFRVGSGNVESGLEEGILLLRQGDRARLILPPHLAFGLLGDEKHIPARSVIIYDLEVLTVEDE